jgi:hypothetical protein
MPRESAVEKGDDFYVSYSTDLRAYGDVTTALVRGDLMAFYVLLGDHLDAYRPLIPLGFDACLDYFKAHMDEMARYSDVPPVGMLA